jgi:hypothetical protein
VTTEKSTTSSSKSLALTCHDLVHL